MKSSQRKWCLEYFLKAAEHHEPLYEPPQERHDRRKMHPENKNLKEGQNLDTPENRQVAS